MLQTTTLNIYSGSIVETYLKGLTDGGGSFADVADAIVGVDLTDVSVSGAKLWLLNVSEAQEIYDTNPDQLKCSPASGATDNSSIWWLRTKYSTNILKYVNGNNGSV